MIASRSAALAAALLLASACADGAESSDAVAPASLRGAECVSDGDCAEPERDLCNPRHAVCELGVCRIVTEPRPWDGDSGACQSADDCRCQALVAGSCEGAFECRANRCLWVCEANEACATDEDCPAAQICEPGRGCEIDRRCVPGCRTSEDCGEGLVCNRTGCVSCPCTGSCVLDRCFDADGDGYARLCGGPECSGLLPGCDCDDNDPDVNPGAEERCGNGRDDDCDNMWEEGCPACGTEGAVAACQQHTQCDAGVTRCRNGCCVECPVVHPPRCPPGTCVRPGQTDTSGCAAPSTCGPCCDCGPGGTEICGTTYATWENSCRAECAGATHLHTGACEPGEGTACTAASCAPGQYCRNTCPTCTNPVNRCTKVGVCVVDADCPAGVPPPCAGATAACVGGACRFQCP